MTFKHINFDDSFTMRSLERVARDKGWIHETPINKIAALQENDLSISNNLTENVMKLCAGLRASGMHKSAEEVELKFMIYKKAQTLYETSKEKGEDLVDEAHPKGSHKLSNIEGDSVIETIVDQHLAGIKLTEKKPTGKLASSDALKAVKNILAQAANPVVIQQLNIVLRSVKTIFNLHEETSFLARPIMFGKDNLIENINEAISNANNPELLDQLFPKIKLGLDKFYSNFKPGMITGVDASTWAGMTPLFNKANTALNAAQKVINEKGEVPISPEIGTLTKWISNAKSTLKKWETIIGSDPDREDADKETAISWISKKMGQVTDIENKFQSLNDEEKASSAIALLTNLKKITTPSFGQFKSNWEL
jgi:hypothetical protein